MPIAVDAMADLGMLAGIPAEKLTRNAGEHVTVPEIRSALAAYDAAGRDATGVFRTYAAAELAAPRPTLLEAVLPMNARPYRVMEVPDAETLDALCQKWVLWIGYLREAMNHGGFKVW
jgi:hypothetical protein